MMMLYSIQGSFDLLLSLRVVILELNTPFGDYC